VVSKVSRIILNHQRYLFPDFITPLTYGVLVKEGVKMEWQSHSGTAGAGLVPVNFTQKYNSNLGLYSKSDHF